MIDVNFDEKPFVTDAEREKRAIEWATWRAYHNVHHPCEAA